MKRRTELNELSKNEVDLMKRIKHDNITRYYEHFDETISGSQYFCFVCEFCQVIVEHSLCYLYYLTQLVLLRTET